MTADDDAAHEAELREIMQQALNEGFLGADDIIDIALENTGKIAPCDAALIVERLLPDMIREKLAVQKTWPPMTDCDRLDAAFTELTNAGIVCQHNFSCCQTCGFAEIGAEVDDERARGIAVRGVAFYHAQDTQAVATALGGPHTLHIAYRALSAKPETDDDANLAVAHEITRALERHGLACSWDGSISRRNAVRIDWKRRLTL